MQDFADADCGSGWRGRRRFGAVGFAVLLALTGCAASESESQETGNQLTKARAVDFEGVYTLSARTQNRSGCTVGGDILAMTGDTHFVLVSVNILGQELLELVSCRANTCAELATKTKEQTIVGSEYRYSFSGTTGPDVVTGFMAWSGGDNGASVCTERTFDEFTLTRTGDTLKVERTTKALPDAPAEDGYCFADPDLQKKEAAGAACTELETFEAKWSGELP